MRPSLQSCASKPRLAKTTGTFPTRAGCDRACASSGRAKFASFFTCTATSVSEPQLRTTCCDEMPSKFGGDGSMNAMAPPVTTFALVDERIRQNGQENG